MSAQLSASEPEEAGLQALAVLELRALSLFDAEVLMLLLGLCPPRSLSLSTGFLRPHMEPCSPWQGEERAGMYSICQHGFCSVCGEGCKERWPPWRGCFWGKAK
jgi:hypothetical protein